MNAEIIQKARSDIKSVKGVTVQIIDAQATLNQSVSTLQTRTSDLENKVQINYNKIKAGYGLTC